MKVTTVLRDTATDCRDIVETEWVKWLGDPLSRVKQFEDGEITQKELHQFLKAEDLRKHFTENKTKHRWTFKHNGSCIRFTGLDDDDKVMGMTQNVCWVNEPYNFAHEVYKQLAQRTTDFLLVDWNPKKTHWLNEEQKKDTTIVLKSTFRDNPFCPKGSSDQILSYQPLNMCDAYSLGKIDQQELRTYDLIANPKGLTPYEIEEISRCRYNEDTGSASAYHWSVYGLGIGAERPNRIYHWNEITLEDYYKIDAKAYYYSDWGAVDPWAIGELKYYDGGLYIRELNYESENQIRARLTVTEREIIGADDEGLVTWMFNKLNVPKDRHIICDTNRFLKIRALRLAGYEYAIGAIKGKIIDGVDLLNNLKVFFTGDSANVKYEQENYSRSVDRYGIVQEEPEDVDNHHMDGVRYVATYLQAHGIIKKI